MQGVIREYGDYLDAGLFYYGDATGASADTRGTENDYDIVGAGAGTVVVADLMPCAVQ